MWIIKMIHLRILNCICKYLISKIGYIHRLQVNLSFGCNHSAHYNIKFCYLGNLLVHLQTEGQPAAGLGSRKCWGWSPTVIPCLSPGHEGQAGITEFTEDPLQLSWRDGKDSNCMWGPEGKVIALLFEKFWPNWSRAKNGSFLLTF